MAGYSLGSALNFVVIYNLGAITGSIGGWLSSKINIKFVLIASYSLGALALTALPFNSSEKYLYVMVYAVGASTLGSQLLAYAYASDFYPSHIRSSGVGFASGVGRVGAIISPVVIGWVVSMSLPFQQNFMVISFAGVIAAVAICIVKQRNSDSHRTERAGYLQGGQSPD
ncbi:MULTISPECIES: MFS transporter [unclassified Pseudomonas]|uniref:MFS transporter n=1 Tax=unclassified Pseudomonas TaxID=196821 RepID=UPI00211E1E94|nr:MULTISPECIES: MFS transporter [unclassified Pseudomonas]